ncbi:MAG: hypothetical protein FWC94_06990 [Bacteroidales bacterium]|nr:hypothetical protein [Bacteroidales bacterium]
MWWIIITSAVVLTVLARIIHRTVVRKQSIKTREVLLKVLLAIIVPWTISFIVRLFISINEGAGIEPFLTPTIGGLAMIAGMWYSLWHLKKEKAETTQE